MSAPLVQNLYQLGNQSDASRERGYTTYNPSSYPQSHPRGHMQASFASTSQYVPADYYTPALAYPQQELVSLGAQLPPQLEVLSLSPTRGIPGSKLTVEFRSYQDLCSPPFCFFTVIFRDVRASAVLSKMETLTQPYQYTLSTDVPTCSTAAWVDTLPLFLSMEDETGQSLGMQALGDFQYTPTPFHYSSSPHTTQDASRKRKLSQSGNDFLAAPTKRPATQATQATHWMHNKARFESNALVKSHSQPGLSTPFHSDDSMGIMSQARFSQSPLPPRSMMGMPADSTFATAISPKSAYPFASLNNNLRTPDSLSISMPGHFPYHPVSPLTGGASSNPTLIRTSTLPQSSASSAVNPMGSPAGTNPYGVFSNKAILKINGSLDSVLDDWSDIEWSSRRRLIEFERMQTGNTITTSFKPVTPEARMPNSICISCIWWEEKHEAFVTSVDTIYLLEALVAVRFTVEEKNRIRRNLEGFRPLTVSKGKADSESFFKVIMGFPNPKPRNIEKDVKVFPWKILSQALKKIIGKYSASYTATPGDFPVSMTYTDGPVGLSPTSNSSSPPSLGPATSTATHSSETSNTSTTNNTTNPLHTPLTTMPPHSTYHPSPFPGMPPPPPSSAPTNPVSADDFAHHANALRLAVPAGDDVLFPIDYPGASASAAPAAYGMPWADFSAGFVDAAGVASPLAATPGGAGAGPFARGSFAAAGAFEQPWGFAAHHGGGGLKGLGGVPAEFGGVLGYAGQQGAGGR